MSADGHVHQVGIFLKVCDEPAQHMADVDVFGDDDGDARRSLAAALRSLANVIDTKGTFEELVEGL